jgi:hypothetical protein
MLDLDLDLDLDLYLRLTTNHTCFAYINRSKAQRLTQSQSVERQLRAERLALINWQAYPLQGRVAEIDRM